MHFINSNNFFVNTQVIGLEQSNFLEGGGGIVLNMDLF